MAKLKILKEYTCDNYKRQSPSNEPLIMLLVKFGAFKYSIAIDDGINPETYIIRFKRKKVALQQFRENEYYFDTKKGGYLWQRVKKNG